MESDESLKWLVRELIALFRCVGLVVTEPQVPDDADLSSFPQFFIWAAGNRPAFRQEVGRASLLQVPGDEVAAIQATVRSELPGCPSREKSFPNAIARPAAWNEAAPDSHLQAPGYFAGAWRKAVRVFRSAGRTAPRKASADSDIK